MTIEDGLRSFADASEIRNLLDQNEPECARDLLWASLSNRKTGEEMTRLFLLCGEFGIDVKMERSETLRK